MNKNDFRTLVSIALSDTEDIHPVHPNFWLGVDESFKEHGISRLSKAEAKEAARQYVLGIVEGVRLREDDDRTSTYSDIYAAGLRDGYRSVDNEEGLA